jgi:hypothetical protein
VRRLRSHLPDSEVHEDSMAEHRRVVTCLGRRHSLGAAPKK